ncbi:MAG: tRNA (guanosine(37)-N1)-methyltransferase TrmD [Deltaproteobacteria bacterium]|nr:MAG: tRNA (guanosine(37)-N1)-methyltransferase TrmD [Deltaproteobacteria bacterium]
MMRFDILTIFPEMFATLIDYGIIGRAVKRRQIKINVVNIRDFGKGPHMMTDDRPFGGGDGMVMKPGPIFRALESIPRLKGDRRVILLTPQGQLFNQSIARDLTKLKQIVLVCGRYEGVDDRVRSRCVDMEISIGDYILTGGELPAMVIVEVVSRLVPGILGGVRSSLEESFEDYFLEYPQFTRPRVFQGEGVPSVLLSGDHGRIRLWRRTQSIKRTLERRPDLLEKAHLSERDKCILEELKENQGSASALSDQGLIKKADH